MNLEFSYEILNNGKFPFNHDCCVKLLIYWILLSTTKECGVILNMTMFVKILSI